MDSKLEDKKFSKRNIWEKIYVFFFFIQKATYTKNAFQQLGRAQSIILGFLDWIKLNREKCVYMFHRKITNTLLPSGKTKYDSVKATGKELLTSASLIHPENAKYHPLKKNYKQV